MIRLQRVGRKHEPTFRVVVTESQNSTKSGRFLEVIGNFDPRHPKDTKVDEARVKHWVAHGAQLSTTMHNMLVESKVISGNKKNALPKRTPIKKEEAKEEKKAPATEAVLDAAAAAEVAPDAEAAAVENAAPQA